MELKWSYALLIMVLLGCGSCLDWQAAGNFTSDNLTVLYTMINSVDPSELTSSLSMNATTISDELNTLWDPAWNVVIVYYGDGNNYDSVLYGYGFREHWFWFNGWKRSDGTHLTFIIWKDYNCVGWVTYAPISPASSYNAVIFAELQSVTSGMLPITDIWSVAKNVQSVIPTADPTILQDPLGYTIIASQYAQSTFFARMCVSQYAVVGNIGFNSITSMPDG